MLERQRGKKENGGTISTPGTGSRLERDSISPRHRWAVRQVMFAFRTGPFQMNHAPSAANDPGRILYRWSLSDHCRRQARQAVSGSTNSQSRR